MVYDYWLKQQYSVHTHIHTHTVKKTAAAKCFMFAVSFCIIYIYGRWYCLVVVLYNKFCVWSSHRTPNKSKKYKKYRKNVKKTHKDTL